jgi:tetratricopeptide (TPR) repeat protein
MRLSAALIVKNEERFLAGCLASLRGLTDQVVVLDTGSTDRTVALAGEAGAEVHRREPRGPFRFDEARNAALDLCSGDWILYIDADERVAAGSRAALERELSDPRCLAARLPFRPRVGQTPYLETRLFRNRPELRFRGAIHETILPALGELLERGLGHVGEASLELVHLGYEGDLTHKYRRNLPLLREAVEADPHRVYLWCDLGRACAGLGDAEGAERAWRQACAQVRAQPEVLPVDVLAFVDLIEHLRARGAPHEQELDEARALFPRDAHLRWLSGQLRLSQERHEEALALLAGLVEEGPPRAEHDGVAVDERLFGPLAYPGLALANFRLGRFADAAVWYERALALAPDDLELKAKAAICRARARR